MSEDKEIYLLAFFYPLICEAGESLKHTMAMDSVFKEPKVIHEK